MNCALERIAVLIAKSQRDRTRLRYVDRQVRSWEVQRLGLSLPAERKFLPWTFCEDSDIERVLREVRIIDCGNQATYTTWLRSDDCEEFIWDMEREGGANVARVRALRAKAIAGAKVGLREVLDDTTIPF